MDDIEYEVTEDDYKKIIQLQLVVAEEVSRKHLKEFDSNHFLLFYISFELSEEFGK